MNIILELDPVEFGEDIFNLDFKEEADLGFLSLDSKVDWSLPTQEGQLFVSSGENRSDTKGEDFQQSTQKERNLLDKNLASIAAKTEEIVPGEKAETDDARSRATGNISGTKEILNKTKLVKNGNKKSRRRRKKITVRRDQYKKRKDVLLKSILRKFRKFYQDEYANFTRLKFLESSSKTSTEGDLDVFPLELEKENSQDMTKEALEAFANIREFESFNLKDISFPFFGSLISPRTFKGHLEDGTITLDTRSDEKRMIDYCQLVDEVLYKFSYQKLFRFCKIPEFGKLFKYFKNTSCLSTDETNQKYMELIISYIDDQ